MDDLLERLRREELERVRRWIAPGADVLELGGGNGFQASLLAAWGARVVSVDLPDRPRFSAQYYPVGTFDGVAIPFPGARFDVVFSSNVLEHAKRLPALLAETVRVLKPEGFAVHVLPTPSWRLWTSLTHYVFMARVLAGRKPRVPGLRDLGSAKEVLRRRGPAGLASQVLLAGPHGEFPNAIVELAAFRVSHWARVFARAGFAVIASEPTGLFYTGYGTVPRLSLVSRRKLARILGSSGRIFVLRPRLLASES